MIPTNCHHTLGLAPFRRSGCKKAIHGMHNKVQITLDSYKLIGILISVVINHLDYAKIKILSPGGIKPHPESHSIDQMAYIATHKVRMNKVILNHALTVQEKVLH